MSPFHIAFLIILALLIVGTFIVADRIDEFWNGIGNWTDEKPASPPGGDQRHD